MGGAANSASSRSCCFSVRRSAPVRGVRRARCVSACARPRRSRWRRRAGLGDRSAPASPRPGPCHSPYATRPRGPRRHGPRSGAGARRLPAPTAARVATARPAARPRGRRLDAMRGRSTTRAGPPRAAPSRSAGPAGVVDKAHHLGPRRRRGRDPAGPVPGTGSRGRLGVHRPRRGAAGREPGASAPARSRPHGKNDQATIKTREATMRCAATPCYRHGRRAPGAGPPAGAGQHQAQLTRPPPANHRVGRRQGRQAQAPTGPPRTPGPAASRRRPDRRTPRRPN